MKQFLLQASCQSHFRWEHSPTKSGKSSKLACRPSPHPGGIPRTYNQSRKPRTLLEESNWCICERNARALHRNFSNQSSLPSSCVDNNARRLKDKNVQEVGHSPPRRLMQQSPPAQHDFVSPGWNPPAVSVPFSSGHSAAG